jgi:hypothetical protein
VIPVAAYLTPKQLADFVGIEDKALAVAFLAAAGLTPAARERMFTMWCRLHEAPRTASELRRVRRGGRGELQGSLQLGGKEAGTTTEP